VPSVNSATRQLWNCQVSDLVQIRTCTLRTLLVRELSQLFPLAVVPRPIVLCLSL
jgi:hypothetical protein